MPVCAERACRICRGVITPSRTRYSPSRSPRVRARRRRRSRLRRARGCLNSSALRRASAAAARAGRGRWAWARDIFSFRRLRVPARRRVSRARTLTNADRRWRATRRAARAATVRIPPGPLRACRVSGCLSSARIFFRRDGDHRLVQHLAVIRFEVEEGQAQFVAVVQHRKRAANFNRQADEVECTDRNEISAS